MKDNKLPVMSNEEREKAWQELKEGDTLVHISWSKWDEGYNVRYLKVIKITPKGSARLDSGTLLKTFENGYHIITCELNNWIQRIKLENSIVNLIYKVDRDNKGFKENLTYEDAKLLKEILERTLEGVERVK